MMFYDDPDFIEEMMDADADYIIAVMDQVLDVAPVDCFQYWEDMAYNTGPLLTPSLARKYMLPRYKRVNDHLYSRGVKFIGLDSDGKIDALIPIWLESGMNYLFPFEVQCGMDVLRVRREYGKDLRIIGGVDKRVIAIGPEAIDAEINRLRPLMEEGGYIPMTDHSIPPNVSFENYVYYMKRMREACEQVGTL
jgi:uroporphyrinogen decarboxylase